MTARPGISAFFLAGGLLALADQAIKRLVTANFVLGESLALIPGFLSLTYIRNRGGAFGIFTGFPPMWGRLFFVAATLAALVFVYYLYRYKPPESAYGRLALVLIFGGGLGNLVDRVLLGEVVDFVDVYLGSHHWPAFNLADSGISVGVVLLALDVIRRPGD
ncbi:MAG: signal peptidase II [bacterium]